MSAEEEYRFLLTYLGNKATKSLGAKVSLKAARTLIAERDAARSEATRLREALAASLDHCKTWHGDCCPCEGGPNGEDFCSAGETVDQVLAALTSPTDQGEVEGA